MKRLLPLLALFALSVPAFAQADLQDVVDAVDEVAELLYNLNSRIGYIADGPYRLTLEDGMDRLASVLVDESVYWTNAVDWTSDRHRGRQSGIRRDLWDWFAPYIPSADMGGLMYSPNDRWGFLWYSGEEDETTDSHLEFETLVFGQNVDASILMDDRLWNESGEEFRDYVFDAAFNPYTNSYFGGVGLGFWNGWQAEAWRRLLALQTGSDVPAWTNNVAATNALDDVWTSAGYTNEDGNATGVLPSPGDVQLQTNAVTWFGGFDDPDPLLPKLDWTLSGDAYEVKLFGFEELEEGLTGSLSIDFADQPWPLVRKVMQFIFSVTFCVGAFMILRTEWNYWTTLGGSST